MSRQLKAIFLDEFGGFADKRIKKVDKGHTFIVDDRDDGDIGADGKLLSYFCMIFADVRSDDRIEISLNRNVPTGPEVKKWLRQNNLTIDERAMSLRFEVTPATYNILSGFADAVSSITAPGAPRYSVASYKYVCPRTAASLRRLHAALDKAWNGGNSIGFGL